MSTMSDPMPGPPMRKMMRLARHDPALVPQSIHEATNFYEWDKRLSQQDRSRLESCFRRRAAFFPLVGIPFAIGGAMLPKLMRNRGVAFLSTPFRFRAARVVLGFAGLMVGFRVSSFVTRSIHLSKLEDNLPAHQAYAALSRYPPMIGAKYFRVTKWRPDLALQDPKTIDWDHNALFPMILLAHTGGFRRGWWRFLEAGRPSDTQPYAADPQAVQHRSEPLAVPRAEILTHNIHAPTNLQAPTSDPSSRGFSSWCFALNSPGTDRVAPSTSESRGR